MHINNGILHEYSYSNFPLSVWEGAYRAAGDNASKRDSLIQSIQWLTRVFYRNVTRHWLDPSIYSCKSVETFFWKSQFLSELIHFKG